MKHNTDDRLERGHDSGKVAHPDSVASAHGQLTASDRVIQLLTVIAASMELIASRLGSLPSEIAHASMHGPGKTLRRADREALMPLADAVWTAIGSADFLARELLEHAKTDERLRTTIEAAVRGHQSQARALGRLLLRGEGIALDGLFVRRLATTRGGTLWRIERV